jgi:8-oxo-dGTP pyrophosphatase MutT (NUDIX family)
MIMQSGVIPYFTEDDTIKYVLVTSSSDPNQWIFPKGMREPNMTAWQSAEMEGIEEAGVYGEISTQVCTSYRYQKWTATLCHVDMYLLKVVELAPSWIEDMFRRRRVCTYEEAFSLLSERIRPILFTAQQQLTKK